MPDTANDGETTDDIEPQVVTSAEQENLLKQLVQDKIFHKREDGLGLELIRQIQEEASELRGDERLEWFNSKRGLILRITAYVHKMESGEYTFFTLCGIHR